MGYCTWWDSNEAQQLPDCMKICFQALYAITNEIAHEIQKEKGWGRVLPLLKKVVLFHSFLILSK
ncbi:hypothetical protein L1049_007421 [Liquidambar formosana]|uniref:Terpene synthase metal-binding domain-containing protein n=1 Tax=Liquidambar formosana TaxID=63359 RepID=A0AAP0N572_LIQFO